MRSSVDVRMQVAHAHPELAVVFGQVLGQALGERRDQHPLALLHPLANLGQ